MQLYYGPTSHFALMQHIYRDLVSNPTAQSELPGGVEEAGAGLDLFSFRRIFFGTPDTQESAGPSGMAEVPVMFLPYDLAKLFLSRFLNTLYHMMPHRPKYFLEQCLELLYSPSPTGHLDALTQGRVLLALATGALGTEHYAWGDVLFERVKASLTSYDDVVNLHTIQISLLMICASLFQYSNIPLGANLVIWNIRQLPERTRPTKLGIFAPRHGCPEGSLRWVTQGRPQRRCANCRKY